MAQLAGQGGASGDPQVAYALRGVRMMAKYMRSVCRPRAARQHRLGRRHADPARRRQGRRRLRRLRQAAAPGPGVGRAVPAARQRARLRDAREPGRRAPPTFRRRWPTLTDAGTDRRAHEREKVRKAFERAALTTDGELAYAVWPGRAGGVGLGGAYRVNNAGRGARRRRRRLRGAVAAARPRGHGRARARRRVARAPRQGRGGARCASARPRST